MLSVTPEMCSYVVKCIDKQLKYYEKCPKVLFLTLILLETLVKNCSVEFHRCICTKEFMHRLKKTGGTRIAQPKKRREKTFKSLDDMLKDKVEIKVLALIQSFGPLHPSDLTIFNETYEKLKKQGVEFPIPDPSDLTPLTTAEREVLRKSTDAVRIPSDVKAQLEQIKQSISLFEAVLESMEPSEEPKSNELARDLSQNVRDMKPKLIQLVERYSAGDSESDERITAALFVLFERLDNSIDRYEGNLPNIPEDFEKPLRRIKGDLQEPPLKDVEFSDPNGDPIELGLNLLAGIKPKQMKRTENDLFLQWLLS